jgi:hypothetical protein
MRLSRASRPLRELPSSTPQAAHVGVTIVSRVSGSALPRERVPQSPRGLCCSAWRGRAPTRAASRRRPRGRSRSDSTRSANLGSSEPRGAPCRRVRLQALRISARLAHALDGQRDWQGTATRGCTTSHQETPGLLGLDPGLGPEVLPSPIARRAVRLAEPLVARHQACRWRRAPSRVPRRAGRGGGPAQREGTEFRMRVGTRRQPARTPEECRRWA